VGGQRSDRCVVVIVSYCLLRVVLSAFHLAAFFLHPFTPLVQNNSWLLQQLQDQQERRFLHRSPFGVWYLAGQFMSLVSLISKSLVALLPIDSG
jgi:hypothetical protein